MAGHERRSTHDHVNFQHNVPDRTQSHDRPDNLAVEAMQAHQRINGQKSNASPFPGDQIQARDIAILDEKIADPEQQAEQEKRSGFGKCAFYRNDICPFSESPVSRNKRDCQIDIIVLPQH
jgi:hypothetical protein